MGRMSPLAIISSERESLRLATLERMAAQQMTRPQKMQRTMALEQLLENIMEVAVRKTQNPISTEMTWMTFSKMRRLEHCSSPLQKTTMLQVSRYMREKKQRKPKKWMRGQETEQMTTIASTMKAKEQEQPRRQLSLRPYMALCLTLVTLSYHREASQQSRNSSPGLTSVVKKETAVWFRMKIQQNSPSACLQMREKSSIQPHPVCSSPMMLRVSRMMEPKITLMMKQTTVILNSLSDHSLRRVLRSHSTILLMRKRRVLLSTSSTAGPMMAGILTQVSVEVSAMKKKLMISSSTHRMLKSTKLMSSFLCSPMFTQMRSRGSCAHLTIILASATFQVASSLAYPNSGQMLHSAFPISNSRHSFSAVSILDTTIMQLLMLLRSKFVSSIFTRISSYSLSLFCSMLSSVSSLKNRHTHERLETPQSAMMLVILSRYSLSRRSWQEGVACTAIMRSSCCMSSTRYCCIWDLMEASSMKWSPKNCMCRVLDLRLLSRISGSLGSRKLRCMKFASRQLFKSYIPYSTMQATQIVQKVRNQLLPVLSIVTRLNWLRGWKNRKQGSHTHRSVMIRIAISRHSRRKKKMYEKYSYPHFRIIVLSPMPIISFSSDFMLLTSMTRVGVDPPIAELESPITQSTPLLRCGTFIL